MKKNYKIILIIIAVVAIAYLAYKWYVNNGFHKVFGGTQPTAEDIACASGGGGGRMIIGSCTKPFVYPIPRGTSQKCFTSEQLGLGEGDSGPAIVTDLNGFGTKWYFNYQSGDRFCYVNKLA